MNTQLTTQMNKLYRSFSTFSIQTLDNRHLLDQCKTSSDATLACKIHGQILKMGLNMNASLISSLMKTYITCGHPDFARWLRDETLSSNVGLIIGNKMISSFMKEGDIDTAKKVFINMPCKDVISWNSMISGYVKNSRYQEAFKLFKDMCSLNIEADAFTFSSVITGCARVGALDHGLWIHDLIKRKKIVLSGILLASLVDMFAKCGKIEIARELFRSTESTDVSVWNAMITGLAIHGLASDSISLFSQMEEKKVSPNAITFLAILTACSHCGLVEMGQKYFHIMWRNYSIEPQLEHYGAMVDLLGRSGRLEEAYTVIKSMPMTPDVIIWRTLLSACRTHKNSILGEIAIANISSLDSGDYVLLSNTYSSLQKWTCSENTRKIMINGGVRKDRGKSWIELAGVIYLFKACDKSHPETEAIYKILKQLIARSKIEGFVPSTELVLMDVSEEEKEENLFFHSEKLALAFAVLKTSPRTEIRISKNLRTCNDCHSWFKIVSKILRRVIVVRDRTRFHMFEGGLCSCGDYW